MAPGHTLKGYLPGDASGGILPAAMADLPLAFGTLEEHGCFVGSGAVVVLSEADGIAAVARNLMRFFEDESCGQCTPCRVGTEKAVQLMDRPVWDQALLEELSAAMREASICGLVQAAPNPLDSVFRLLPDDVPKQAAHSVPPTASSLGGHCILGQAPERVATTECAERHADIRR